MALSILLSPNGFHIWTICPVGRSCYQSARKVILTRPDGRTLPLASFLNLL